MNAHTNSLEGKLLSGGSVLPFMQDEPFEMGSNIARDLKSRAADFKTKAAALFEYVVNGYEGYQQDQTPVVEVTTKGGKIVIKDNGVGMSFEKLRRFWTLHGNTERRENGRNKRGYHGSGKVAFYMFADKIEVRTVKDGLLNVMSLEREEIETAAESGKAPRITLVTVQKPTDEQDGTTITISRLRDKFTTEDARQLNEKLAENLRLVMTGAVVTVNGERIVERPVRGIEHNFNSICGNFSATIYHNDAGHPDDDDRVFYMVDGVYIAAMQTGKEGHRFSHQVSALVNTTKAWAVEHFEHRRERFMSEARDLTLKTSDPAAKELHDFAEAVVKDFMDKLDAQDRERKKEKASEEEKRLLQNMSRIFSSHLIFGGKAPRPRPEVVDGPTPQPEPVAEKKQRIGKGSNNDQRKPKIQFALRPYEMADAPYVIERGDALVIYFNESSKVYKSLAQDERDNVRNAVLWDIAAQAVCEIAVTQTVEEQEQNEGPVSTMEVVRIHADKWAAIKNCLSEVYANFLDQSPTA